MNRYQPLRAVPQVTFDPSNVEHMHAYVDLRFGTQKLYKGFRFTFDESRFGDVLSAMNEAVARHVVVTFGDSALSDHLVAKERGDEWTEAHKKQMQVRLARIR